MADLIEIKNLVKNFEVGKTTIFALRGVNLNVKEGEFLIIEGASGSGKTTLINMVAGLEKFDQGEIIFANKSLQNVTLKEMEQYHRKEIGIVFQDFNLISSLSAWENVALPLRFSGIGKNIRKKRALQLLEIVGLKERAEHCPYALSGGEKQRVAIARALAGNPKIILADEPTGNLDSKNGAEIMNLLKDLNEKYHRTILLVTHNPLYSGYGQRILTMEDGNIISEKKLAPLKNQGETTNKAEDIINSFKLPNFENRMRLKDILGISLRHFNYAKIRAFLTTLGMAIGICAIALLVSLGFGLQKTTISSMANMEELQTLTVTQKDDSEFIDPQSMASISQISNIKEVSPSLSVDSVVVIDDMTASVVARGIKKDYLDIESIAVTSGSQFSSNSASEAIISGPALAALSLSDEAQSEIVGKEISLQIPETSSNSNIVNLSQPMKKISVTVVGIAKNMKLAEIDLPLDFLQYETGNNNYTALNIKISDLKKTNSIKSAIEEMGFDVTGIFALIGEVNRTFSLFEFVLGLIGGIALLVASFGIVNTMTISLLERTREIGVMKALGISRKDIKRLFIYEACYYGLFGSIIGLCGSFIIGQIINISFGATLKNQLGLANLNLFIMPWWFAILLLFFAIMISYLAGIYPSNAADKKSPLEALRYE